MYRFNSYFLPCLNYLASRGKNTSELKTKLTKYDLVFSIVLTIHNHKSIQLSILKVRMNNSMLWYRLLNGWKKKFDLGSKNNVLVEWMSNSGILKKNIFKRGINGLTKCWLILHFEKHQFFIKSIPQQVMFLVFLFLHFLCKSIQSFFSDIWSS